MQNLETVISGFFESNLATNLELTPAHRFQRTPIYLGAQTSPHSDLLRTLPH